MNKVILIGNLTRDPELRTTTSGISVCSVRLAVQRRVPNAQGVREADFIDVVAWRQTAEFVSRYFTKGRRMAVVGQLQTRTYDAKDGTKRYVTEVVADEVEFCDSRPQGAEGGGAYTAPAPKPAPAANNDFTGQGFTQVDDDELPF